MRFDTSQHMKLGQQMKLAPRMIQSMEILQMPLAELEERIEQELASNPTLELQEGDGEPVTETEGTFGEETYDADGELDAGEGADDFARLDQFGEDNPEAAENDWEQAERSRDREPIDWRHEAPGSRSRLDGEPDARAEMLAAAPSRGESLQEQLLRQWAVVDVDERLRPLGTVLIGFLEDDGYLRAPLGEVAKKATKPAGINGHGWPPTLDDLELALRAVQLLLEPAGVAARNARECLLLQIDAQLDLVEQGNPEDQPLVAAPSVLLDARVLVEDHLDDLMKNRLPKIAEKSGLELDEIRGGLEALKRLSLAPARRLVEERSEPIVPDAIVEYDEHEDRYFAYLNDRRLPVLQINRAYAEMSKDSALEKRDRDFIKTNLSNAQWLMDAVEQRRGTLMRVINAVLREQRAYFDQGPAALKPLPMTQVAEQLGVHVATVSRAVSDKHLLTPRGVVPLRSFFTGGLATESGEEVSASAVHAALRELVDGEDKAKPLSDEALAKALQAKGIEIARRTVAKYRGQLDIPSARMRKTF